MGYDSNWKVVSRCYIYTYIHLSNEKRAPGNLGFIREYTTQLCRKNQKNIIRIPIKKTSNNGK